MEDDQGSEEDEIHCEKKTSPTLGWTCVCVCCLETCGQLFEQSFDVDAIVDHTDSHSLSLQCKVLFYSSFEYADNISIKD